MTPAELMALADKYAEAAAQFALHRTEAAYSAREKARAELDEAPGPLCIRHALRHGVVAGKAHPVGGAAPERELEAVVGLLADVVIAGDVRHEAALRRILQRKDPSCFQVCRR